MPLLKSMSSIMETPWAYALWQKPQMQQKFAPVRRHNDLTAVRRILDVGCGPGTNAEFFTHADYTGIDINPAYIERARRKYGRTFIEGDVYTYQPPPDQHYDFVLLNSLLHHIDDGGVDRLLDALRKVITPGGSIHIIDLVLPDERGVPRWLALNDRGDYPRRLSAWNELFSRHFVPSHEEVFPVYLAGVESWQLIYFKGQPRP